MSDGLARLYALPAKIGDSLQSILLLAVRLYWGWQFAQNGWGKLHNLGRVTKYFASLGLPAPEATATFISILEFGGGILLILGLASRWIAIPLIVDMAVAYIVADRQALFSLFSDPGKFYGADPYTFLFAALLVFIFGPGKISLDAFLARRLRRDSAPHRENFKPFYGF
ncbi:MAG: DoxX family protein [Acidobacteriaceae bacterium]|nr:DoxX family protein [Acidobacteriaceae bacterium]MBV9779021.1 DoxX family protein [Acidobacteriaceae bacterium]